MSALSDFIISAASADDSLRTAAFASARSSLTPIGMFPSFRFRQDYVAQIVMFDATFNEETARIEFVPLYLGICHSRTANDAG
jgi:hypothetical protein